LLTTKDTVAIETPAASATSRMVVAIARPPIAVSVEAGQPIDIY
jgi:hypothetical protein